MNELRYTLLTDGSSDASLIPILNWLLTVNGFAAPIQPTWGDLRKLPDPPRRLTERIHAALDLYPCDLLFVHRDAENEPTERRISEIQDACNAVIASSSTQPYISIVPVRMTEAWLLFDENAIRFAAGNSNGDVPLSIPPLSTLESLPDPKQVLHELLISASELNGRRLKTFRVHRHARRVAEAIEDFSPLRSLSAFALLEEHICRFIGS